MEKNEIFNKWQLHSKNELIFWDKFFQTKGENYPGDLYMRLNPDQPLADYHRTFIDWLPQEKIRILDVGAGPLTIVGKKHPSKMLEIIATDALSEEYDQLLAKYQFSPPIRTIACYAENLTELFPENSFDFVYARNSIDHTYDPYKAIIQMLLVVKENHFVCLNHFEKEGERSSYSGLHQWNFHIENNAFLLSGKSIELNISDELSSIGDFVHLETQGRWVVVHIQKHFGIKRQQIEKLLAVHEERTRVYRDINIDSILSQQLIRVLLIYALRRLLHKLHLKSNWNYRESEIVPLGLPRPIQNG